MIWVFGKIQNKVMFEIASLKHYSLVGENVCSVAI